MINYNELESAVICDQNLIGEFASFLCETKQLTRNIDQSLMRGTALTIFSNTKTWIKKKFPNAIRKNGIFEENF